MADFNTRLAQLRGQYPGEDPEILKAALEMQDAEQAMPRGLDYSREKGLRSVVGDTGTDSPYDFGTPPANYSMSTQAPKQSTPMPMAEKSDLELLRSAIPEYAKLSDAGIALAISKEYGVTLDEVAAELGVRFDQPGVKSSFDRFTGSTLKGLGQWGEDRLGLQDNSLKQFGQEMIDTNLASGATIFDDPGMATREIGGQVGSALMQQLGIQAVASGLQMIPHPVTQAIGAGLRFAGPAVAFAAPAYEGIRERQEQNGQKDLLAAEVGALGVGAIEQKFGVNRFLKPGVLSGSGERALVREFAATPLKTAGKTLGRTALEEGAEELAQNPIEQYTGGDDPTSEASLRETGIGAVHGVVGGAMFGSVPAGVRGVQHSRVAGELDPFLVDPNKRAPTDLLVAGETRDYQNYIAPIQEDAQDWNQLREGVIPESVAAEMPTDESSQAPEFQWNQPARTKADIETAFNEPVGTVGGKTITAWDEYKASHPEVFGKKPVTKTAATSTAQEADPAVLALRSAGIRPTPTRVQLVTEAQQLQADGLLTKDDVDDIINRAMDSKQYEKIRTQFAEKVTAAAEVPTTPEAQRAEVQKMLDSLSDEERAVLTKYTYDKQTFEQIADDLGFKNKQKAQRTFEWAKKKLAKKAAAFGVAPEKIDSIFPNENNSLQGGADVQTVTAAELAQTGAAMHVPGEVGAQDINETQNIEGDMQFGEAPVFDEESHLQRGPVEEGVAPTESFFTSQVDHLGIPLKQEDIEDAGVEYDAVAARIKAPKFAELPRRLQAQVTKAYAVYWDKDQSAKDFKDRLEVIANDGIDEQTKPTTQRTVEEEAVAPDVPEVTVPEQTATEVETESGAGAETLEDYWNSLAAEGGFSTWRGLSDEQRARLESSYATNNEGTFNDAIVSTVDDLIGLKEGELVGGVASDQSTIKRLEASIKQAEREQDTTRADWAKKELATISERLNQRVGATPINAMIVWDNETGRVSEEQFAPFREVLQWIADHDILGFHAKRLSAIRVTDGTSSHMWYDVDNNEIHVPVGWFTESEYQQGGLLVHERTRVFMHELGHSIDINPTGFDRFSAHPIFRSASKVDAGGLLYYPRGRIASEMFTLWKHEKKSLTGNIMAYPLEPGGEFEKKYMKQYKESGVLVDVSQPIQREIFAQLFSMYYSDQYGYKDKGGKTAKELLAEEAPNAFKTLGEINEILRRDSSASQTEAKNQGRTVGPTRKAAGPNQGATARPADAQDGVMHLDRSVDDGSRYVVIDRRTGKKVGGPYQNKYTARRALDRFDNAYGGYIHKVVQITPPTTTGNDVVAGVAMRDIADKLAPAKTESGDFWAKLKPKLLTIHQLVDQYGAKLQSLKNYVKSVDSMEQFQQQLAVGAHSIVMDWQNLPKAIRKTLNRVMLDATMWGIHPDKSFTDKLNSHLTAEDQYRYDDLKRRYDALPSHAKSVYSQARDYLNGMWKQRSTVFGDLVRTSYAKLIQRDPDNKTKLEAKRDKLISEHEKQLASVKGPYFPLLRFGDYLTIGKSKDLQALEAQLEGEDVAGRSKIEEQILQMKKESKHYAVYASEYKSKAEAKAKELEQAGLSTKTQLAENHPNALMPFSATGMDRLRSLFDGQFDKGTANKLDRMLTEMYISALPEHNALQRQLKRIGVEGAEENGLRAFARAVEQDSFHLSRMKYNSEVSEHLFKVGLEAKEAGIEYQHVANNLKDRIDLDFQYQRTPVLSMLGRLSSFWHLGVSPAYLLTNATQPWMIALPNLAGRFGMTKTLGAMKNSWADAKNMIVQSKKDGAFADVKFDSLQNLDERKMLQTIRNLGQIDITINFDLGNTAESISPAVLKLQKSLAWANHHIEVSNRLTTALTAYRLAKVSGMDHEAATDFAYKQVIDTQLDYSNANAAYFMKSQHLGGLNKLIMQFRKYQQGMFYLIANNAKQAFAGDKQALQSLMYLMAMQGAFAGAAGVPFLTMAMFLAGFGIDDDDPDGDVETQLRNFLADAMGPEAARVFYKGLPAMLGMDVSKRIGLGDVWDPTPFYDMADFKKAKTGKEAVGGALFALAGPAVGTMSNFADAAVMAETGQLGKAAEKMLPKVLSDILRAQRLGSEGLTTRTGAPVMGAESFSAGDVAQRALGFSPAKESEHYEAQASVADTKARITDRREKLIAGWARYKLLGDDESSSAMDEAIQNWNAKHPNKGERIDRSALLRAMQDRRKNLGKSDAAGVSFKKNDNYLRELDRFAR